MRFWLMLAALAGACGAEPLPDRYYRLLEAGSEMVEAELNEFSTPSLEAIEKQGRWRHFPYAILAPAVLYGKQHPANRRYGDPKMLALVIRIGDLLAEEDERGSFEPRLDSDWDTYLWMEAYRLVENKLGDDRRERWKKAILRNVALLESDAEERLDFPWYNSPYIGTSPNHYANWAANLLLAGRLFGNKKWVDLGARILHRFAETEQTPDGYWGEHSRAGPTTGYNHLTLAPVALYWELTKDPAAMAAMRRATDFHKYFTWPDGTPVEVINDRNRHWGVSAWAQFAFSHFADGRGYAEFLAGFFEPATLTVDQLGRLAQDALYYHEGPAETPPQRRARYARQLAIPAGMRKTGPWVVCLSGIVSTSAVNSRYYLDRQGNVSVFHEKLGLIINGANSKRQPELATFSEKTLGQVFHMPLSSRLQMSEEQDRLSLAYLTFWADLFVPPPSENEATLRFVINGKGRAPEQAQLALQLVLKEGEELETGAGRRVKIGPERVEFSPQELGGTIRHRGWTMKVDEAASLLWPFYPHNPYADAPETELRHAVGVLTVPLRLTPQEGKYVRPGEQEIVVKVEAPRRQ